MGYPLPASTDADASAPRARRPTPDARTANLLAATAGCDPRTARRALENGPDAIRSSHHRARIVEAASALGLTLPVVAP